MVVAQNFNELRASQIDFANLNELYNNLKLIETHNFGDNPVNVTVEKHGKTGVSIIFEYLGADVDYEMRRLNSLFLDRGFKSFTLNSSESTGELIITTLYKTRKDL